MKKMATEIKHKKMTKKELEEFMIKDDVHCFNSVIDELDEICFCMMESGKFSPGSQNFEDLQTYLRFHFHTLISSFIITAINGEKNSFFSHKKALEDSVNKLEEILEKNMKKET